MGTIESHGGQSQSFNVDDWEATTWEPYTNLQDPSICSNFSVYHHKSNSNLEVEKYELFFNSQAEYISYLETFYFRMKYSHLVNTVHIEKTSKKGMCSTFYTAEVYIEHTCLRLIEVIDMPVEEGLLAISSAIDGFEKMFPKTGFFELSTDLMGVTKQGKVKVWINKNFSKNFPEFNKINHNKGENEFVHELIFVIEKLMDYPEGTEKFSDFCNENYPQLTFLNAKSAVKEYHQKHNIPMLKSMKSIVLWVKKNKESRILIHKSESFNKKKESIYQTCQSELNLEDSRLNNIEIKSKKMPFIKVKSRKASYQHRGLNHNHSVADHDNVTDNSKTFSLSKAASMNERNRNEGSQIKFLNNEKSESWLLKRPSELSEFMIGQEGRPDSKHIAKIPSVSFSYKNTGPFSPQNVAKEGWFSVKKEKEHAEKKNLRRSLAKNSISEGEDKVKIYFSKDISHQIDPEIAYDLSEISGIQV